MKRILVARSGALGDVIMATPLLKRIRSACPDAGISFLTGKWSAAALLNNPNVDKVMEFDDSIISKKSISGMYHLRQKIREQHFDACFILDKSWIWGLFFLLCGIRERRGFARGWEGIFHTMAVSFKGDKYEAGCNLDLLPEAKGEKEEAPELFPGKEEIDKAGRRMKELKGAIGIAPGGASNPGQNALLKRWPKENYIALCDSVKKPVVIFGSSDDKGIAQEIMKKTSHSNIHDVTGASIGESKEMMEHCSCIITHDSGALHIASATKTRIIALFGPTPKERFAPGNARVIASKSPPCYTIYGKFVNSKSRQMEEITVKSVIAEMQRSEV